ncbi:SIR2 family NAD-dependent protein deacylase [Parasphingorhabdus pacifica]
MNALDQAAGLISGADALLVCAGAGMGIDSGLPDFRGESGFWRAYPPYERLGLNFADVADPVHFAEDPELAWGFYGHRLDLYRRTRPHPGFELLRTWGERTPGGVRVFTSNVDGQFQAAGFDADHVAECHGSIHRMQCTEPCTDDVWSAEDVAVEVDTTTMRATSPLPTCKVCGQLARPNICMFGDSSWVAIDTQPTLDAVNTWRREHRDAQLVVVEIGAGSALPTVRRYAELASASTGALIRINPREPEVRHERGVSLPMGGLDALHGIDARLP